MIIGLIGQKDIQFYPNGISLDGYENSAEKADAPTIGYLARICPEKGLDLLVDAFIELKRSDQYKDVKLAISGTLPTENRFFLEEQKTKISNVGLTDFVEFFKNKKMCGNSKKCSILKYLFQHFLFFILGYPIAIFAFYNYYFNTIYLIFIMVFLAWNTVRNNIKKQSKNQKADDDY